MTTTTSDRPLLAFHNDPAIKGKYLARVRAHKLADEIAQGYYWENGKGCAVGCTIHSSAHDRYETELGIPTWLAHVEDGTFESLPAEDAKEFPEQFLKAIPVGADLSGVYPKLMLDILAGPDMGLIHLPDLAEDVRQAVEAVAECYRRRIAGDEPTEGEWQVAGDLARDAWAAWDARAAWAARDAWAAWDARAAWAARDARDAWAARAAWAEYCRWQRDRLLHHLSQAPVPT